MRRDPDERRGLEQRLEAADVVETDLLEAGERDRLGFEVDPFADAHVRAQVGDCGDVIERAPEPRLQDDADVVEALLAELAVHAQRVLPGVRSAYRHVRQL